MREETRSPEARATPLFVHIQIRLGTRRPPGAEHRVRPARPQAESSCDRSLQGRNTSEDPYASNPCPACVDPDPGEAVHRMRSTPGTGSQKELHRRTLTAPPHPRSCLTRGCSCSRCNPTSGWLAAARIPCQRHDNAMWCQRTGKSDLNHSGVARRRRISHSPGPRLHLGWFRKAGVNLTWHTHCARIFRTVYPLRNHAVTILVLPKQGV